ncbi:hypothetical protein ABIA39_007200 [Nocardia sp. GAS34]
MSNAATRRAAAVVAISGARLAVDKLSKRFVPDELWASAEPLLPEFTPHPQGAGTAPTDERAVFTAVVFVLTSGCAWVQEGGEINDMRHGLKRFLTEFMADFATFIGRIHGTVPPPI